MRDSGVSAIGVVNTNLDSASVYHRNPVRSQRRPFSSIWRCITGGFRNVRSKVVSLNLNRADSLIENGLPATSYKKGNGFTGNVIVVDNGIDKAAKPDAGSVPHSRLCQEQRRFSFHWDKPLGLGTSTNKQKIVEVHDRYTDKLCAGKPIGGERKEKEIEFLNLFKNDNYQHIANIIGIAEDHIIMENGGTSLKKVIEANKLRGGLDKNRVEIYLVQIIKGLCYLSRKRVVHGDIKPDNLLVQNDNLKICDFGLARNQGEKEYRGKTPICYTPLELHKNRRSENMDIWSAGCVLFMLMTGEPLFPACFMLTSDQKVKVSDEDMLSRINAASWLIELELGKKAKDLFVRMMALNSRDRITPEQAMQHPYIEKIIWAHAQQENGAAPAGVGSSTKTYKRLYGSTFISCEYIMLSSLRDKGIGLYKRPEPISQKPEYINQPSGYINHGCFWKEGVLSPVPDTSISMRMMPLHSCLQGQYIK